MAWPTGTFTTYEAIGQREDLSDTIYNIAPTLTPFMNNAKQGKATAKVHEWQTDTLAAALSTNAALEGDNATIVALTPTVRVGNYLQILTKVVSVSDTEDTAVVKAGRASEMAYQMVKKSKELKRDLEKNLLENIAGSAGSVGSTARKFATMGAWLKTNISKAVNGTTPTYASGVPGFARTDGTQRTFTETILKEVMQSCYINGAEVSTLMVGPFNKQRVSGFAGIAVNRFNIDGAKPGTIIGAADIYVSDFGNLAVVPNRFQRERDAWFLDFEYLSIDWLRGWQAFDLAKLGDSSQKEILGEVTLAVLNEAAQGLAADLESS